MRMVGQQQQKKFKLKNKNNSQIGHLILDNFYEWNEKKNKNQFFLFEKKCY